MYIPRFNQIDDRALLLEVMRTHPFAILFGAQPRAEGEGIPTATHLPLVVHDAGPHGIIEGHFAHANPHWRSLAGHEALVVFNGPHSYVSPTLYAEPLSVPTWNYIAVHATGTLSLVEDEEEKDALLKSLIARHEPTYADTWRELPAGFRRTMLAGIMGFRIPIASIQGKFKLSQNRSETDRRQVHTAHAAGTPEQQALADWMARLAN